MIIKNIVAWCPQKLSYQDSLTMWNYLNLKIVDLYSLHISKYMMNIEGLIKARSNSITDIRFFSIKYNIINANVSFTSNPTHIG